MHSSSGNAEVGKKKTWKFPGRIQTKTRVKLGKHAMATNVRSFQFPTFM